MIFPKFWTAAAAGIVTIFASAAQAMPIDKLLAVNVYRLCDDFGANCASTGPAGNAYFAAEVNKIWAQAGIQVVFTFAENINSYAFSELKNNVQGDGFYDLALARGRTGFSSATTVDMFLVHTIDNVNTYGMGWIGAGGLAIAMDAVMSYGTTGRIDTIAHELGHNLGLVPSCYFNPPLGLTPSPTCNPYPAFPSSDGAGHSTNATQLMADGNIRFIPTSVADIAPNGTGYDQLPSEQIVIARTSTLLQNIVTTPEPASMFLAGFALVALGVSRRARRG